VGRRLRRRAVRHHAVRRAFVRHFVRHPDYQLMPRKFKVAFTASTTTARSRDPRPRLHPARARWRQGRRDQTGGGTSIMARVGATLYDFVEVDNGDYLKVSKPSCASSTARTGCAPTAPGTAQVPGRQGRHRRVPQAWSTRSCRATGSNEREFDATPTAVHPRRGGARPGPYAAARRTATAASSTRSSRRTCAAASDGFNTVEVKVTRGDLTPEQFRGIAQIMRDFTGGTRDDGVAELRPALGPWTRRSTTSGRARRAGPERLRRRHASRHVSCPGTDSCKLGITSSMASTARFRRRSSRSTSPTR
jgi:hypothetical protein